MEWTTREPRTDIAAILASLNTRRVHAAAIGATFLGTLAAAETGLLTPLVASAWVAAVLYLVSTLDDPSPVVKSHKVRRPGMTEREVYRRLTMSNEIQELKKEEQEKARRKAKRKRGGP